MAIREDWVDRLAGRTLKDLRRRQELIELQIEIAHTTLNDTALKNLRDMEDCLAEAVMRSTECP